HDSGCSAYLQPSGQTWMQADDDDAQLQQQQQIVVSWRLSHAYADADADENSHVVDCCYCCCRCCRCCCCWLQCCLPMDSQVNQLAQVRLMKDCCQAYFRLVL